MRHADTGDNPRGANRARPNTDFNGVRAGINQRLRPVFGRHITGHHLNGIGQRFNPRHRLANPLRMAMRRINNHQINTGINQRFRAGKAIIANSCRCGNPQTALLVFCCIRVQLRFFHIFDGNQTNAMIGVIHHQQLFNAVMVQKPLGFFMLDSLFHRDEIFMRH